MEKEHERSRLATLIAIGRSAEFVTAFTHTMLVMLWYIAGYHVLDINVHIHCM